MTSMDPTHRASTAGALVRGTALRTIGQIGWRLGGFAAGIILVRTMAAGDVGKFFFVLSLGALFGLFFDLGLAQSISRQIPRAGTDPLQPNLIYLASIRVLLKVLIVVSAAASLIWLLSSSSRADLVSVSAFLGILIALQTLAGSFLRARGRPWAAELYQAGIPLAFLLAIAILWAARELTPVTVIGSRMGIELVAASILVAAAFSMVKGHDTIRQVPVLRLALPLWLTGLAWVGLEQADVALLGFLTSDRNVGLYAPTLRLAAISAVPFGILFPYVMLASGRMASRSKDGSLQRLYDVAGKVAVASGAPVIAAMFMGPGVVLQGVFGIGGSSVETAARILVIGFFIHSMFGMNSGIAESLVALRALALRSLVTLIFVLAVDVVLISRFGIEGAALGCALGYVTIVLVNAGLVWRSLGLKPIGWGMAGTAGTLAIMVGTLTATGWPQRGLGPLVISALSTWLVTLVVAWRTTNRGDRRMIVQAIRSGRDRVQPDIPRGAGL